MPSPKFSDKYITEIAPPIDFSFKNLKSLDELGNDKPRSTRTGRVVPRGPNLKFMTRAIWLNNNFITNVSDLENFVSSVLELPSYLGWLDLSFNKISEIDDSILKFPELRIIYLHGNEIAHVETLAKLAELKHLRSLTLQGNPIEDIQLYRQTIINMLPQIHNLDFAPVVPGERKAAAPATLKKEKN